jgi:transcriptional regulator with XRE-family HTH domain
MAELLDIAATVKQLRTAAGLSREELAQRSGVSRARIEALENERAPEMGYTSVHRLLRALGQDLVITTFNRGRPTAEDIRRENELMEAMKQRGPARPGK